MRHNISAILFLLNYCVFWSNSSLVTVEDTIIIKAGGSDERELNEFHLSNPDRAPRSVEAISSSSSPSSSYSSHKQECGKVKVPLKKNYHSYLADLRRGILGRLEVQSGELPFVVALMMKHQGQMFYCGGALIDDLHVLTSATCVAHLNQYDVSHLKVYIGDHDIYDPDDVPHLEARVTQIAFHKDFNSQTMINNIALVRLRQPVNFTDIIQPICLSDGSISYDDGASLGVTAGWGQLLFDPMNKLHKLDIRIWTNAECAKKYKKNFFPEITNDMVCAGSPVSSPKNLCRGNNGSPLVIRRKGRYELLGVTSWGIGGETFPCVFERVDKFIYWINRNRGLVN